MSRVIKVHQPTDIWLNLTEKDFKDIKWKILLCEGYDLETSLMNTRYNNPKVKIVNTSKLYLNLCKINKGRVGNEIYFLIKHGLTRSCCRELDTQT